jgi:hypothetical protein
MELVGCAISMLHAPLLAERLPGASMICKELRYWGMRVPQTGGIDLAPQSSKALGARCVGAGAQLAAYTQALVKATR